MTTIVYVTGPSATLMQTERLQELVKLLEAPETIYGFPTPTATTTERLKFVCDADVVVLAKGWDGDRRARRDAQVAVWCEKTTILDVGLRKATALGEEALAAVTYPLDKIQDVLDRGLRVSMFEDTAPVDEAGEG